MEIIRLKSLIFQISTYPRKVRISKVKTLVFLAEPGPEINLLIFFLQWQRVFDLPTPTDANKEKVKVILFSEVMTKAGSEAGGNQNQPESKIW